MSSSSEMIQGLEQASQKHEKEIVIELGSDRILHYVGVYLVIVLAVITKISDLTGKNLSCFPANKSSGYNTAFINYASTYCWETSVENSANLSECNRFNETNVNLLQNPNLIKGFVQWMPYAMLLEAFLFALPSAWWHFRVGARLMGHLKFMQLLLNDIYESVKTIPAGIYRKKAYDPNSYYLDGWGGYNPPHSTTISGETTSQKKSEVFSSRFTKVLPNFVRRRFTTTPSLKVQEDIELGPKASPPPSSSNTTKQRSFSKAESRKETTSEQGKTVDEESQDESENTEGIADPLLKKVLKKSSPTESRKLLDETMQAFSGNKVKDDEDQENETFIKESDVKQNDKQANETKPKIKRSRWAKFFLGEMLDRNLFSMLCYENFASLEHHPYILSVYQLTKTKVAAKDEKGIFPMKQGILRQWCHEENFCGTFLMWSYILKHILGIIISFVVMGAMVSILYFASQENWSASTFKCEVIYHADACVICTINRKRDMLAVMIVNIIVILVYFLMSLAQWCFVRRSGNRATSFYFKDMKDSSNVALLAAFRQAEKEKKKE